MSTIHEKAKNLLMTTEGELEELQTEYEHIDAQCKELFAQRDSLGQVIRHLKHLKNDLEAYVNDYKYWY